MPESPDKRRHDALFAAHHDAVWRYAVRRVGDAGAEDVVAETFLVAWRRIDAVPAHELAWLLGVARKMIANQRRGQRRRASLTERIGRELALAAEEPREPAVPAGAVLAARLQGDGILHMVLAHERTHDASGDGVNPRQDEVWISLADGSWRVRIRLYGQYTDMSFDGRTITVRDSRTGKTTTYAPANPELLKGRPSAGMPGASVEPLTDPQFKIAGETSIDGETLYDLVPTRALPDGLELHWYVTQDGKLRRMVQSAPDVVDDATGRRGPASLTTDVAAYEVLAGTSANRALLRR